LTKELNTVGFCKQFFFASH